MVTVSSKRLVQARFWEGNTFKDSYDLTAHRDPATDQRTDGKPDDTPGTTTFKDRALKAITGETPTVPLTFPQTAPYLDKTLFNKAGDNTKAQIMTPTNDDAAKPQKTFVYDRATRV